MSLIAPFRAERLCELGRLADFIAPPYDVIDAGARGKLAAAGQNIVQLTLPIGEDSYARARQQLDLWRREGVLVREDKARCYVLQQEFDLPGRGSFVRSGVMGAIPLEPYGTGRIKPHERTHRGPKEDRLRLLEATRAMFECLLFFARDRDGALAEEIQRHRMAPPWAVAELDGIRIRIWAVGGEEALEFGRRAGEALYIADGHHRYETARTFGEGDPSVGATLGLVVPECDPGLVTLATHRIVEGPGMTPERVQELVAAVGEVVELSEGAVGEFLTGPGARPGCVVVGPEAGFRGVTFSDPLSQKLEIELVDELITGPLRRLSPETALSYSADREVVRGRVASGRAVGVVVRPITVQTVLDVADRGGFMPQKSTYFVPKVPSGLVMLPY